jgi:receptor protein-tyrosine kinase
LDQVLAEQRRPELWAAGPDSSPDQVIKGQPALWGPLTPADHIPTLTDPFSLVTEEFRLLRVKLDSSEGRDGRAPRVLAFTSAVPGEGKTCTALNMAVAAAQEVGHRVVLVECDLRRRRVGLLLQNPPTIGLSDLLQGKAALEDVLLDLDRPDGLSLIPAGAAPTNPVELLGSRAMADLVVRLRRSFHMVLLDTPPSLHFADAARLGPLVDSYVLVVRSGVAPREGVAAVQRALARFGIAGVVLNDTASSAGKGYGEYYRYYAAYGREQDKGDRS